MKADKERKKALWKVDIELRRQSEEGLEQQEREQSQSLENVVVLDDNIVPVEFKNELPTIQNICLKLQISPQIKIQGFHTKNLKILT